MRLSRSEREHWSLKLLTLKANRHLHSREASTWIWNRTPYSKIMFVWNACQVDVLSRAHQFDNRISNHTGSLCDNIGTLSRKYFSSAVSWHDTAHVECKVRRDDVHQNVDADTVLGTSRCERRVKIEPNAKTTQVPVFRGLARSDSPLAQDCLRGSFPRPLNH